MSEQSLVLYTVRDAVATLTLNRPEVRNAFNRPLHQALMRALKQAERDPQVRCLVITGADRAFCSGQDLTELPTTETPRSIADIVRGTYNAMIGKVRSIPKPVIAAVDGVAAGAGMSLALACDLRIASEDASFIAAFARVGLVPDSGMTYFLPRLIGHARALEMCMTGGAIDAHTALQWGMLNHVAAVDAFPAAVDELAGKLARGPATVISLIKRGFDLAAVGSLAEVLEFEAQAQQVATANPDFAEGLAAFAEKRQPRFGQSS
jgi:2-(1,2-epoxy-1,2-dihydrophenyl)acetyl-CoA isomerase